MCLEFLIRINILLSNGNKYDNLCLTQKESTSAGPELQELCCNGRELDLSKLELTAKRDEPYDTEDLDTVPEGYK